MIRETYGKPIKAGLKVEAAGLARLATTPISRNLVRLFQLSQDMKRAGAGGVPVRAAGVVGAGAMGGGIAWALSNCGIDVRMKDISWDAIAAGMGAASRMFDGASRAQEDDAGGQDTRHASDLRVRGVHGLRAAGLRGRGRDREHGRQEEGPA